MDDAGREKVEQFVKRMEEALGLPPDQSRGILEEVRADLAAHVERYGAEGHSDEEALDLALAQMGNPYALAHHIRKEIPPFGGRSLTVIRYLAAGGLILWTVLLLWTFRAWTYGFSPVVVALTALLHLPAILLLWPRIVWRKNWLFGLIPAGLGLVAALAVAAAGVETTSELPMNADEVEHEAVLATTASTGSSLGPMLVSLALVAVSVVLVLAMQQRRQRRLVILVTMLVVGAVEAVFQLEEMNFRHDRDRVLHDMDAYVNRHGSYPARDNFNPEDLGLPGGTSYGREGDGFILFWNRPLSHGNAIVYSSTDGRVWIQD